MVDAPQMINGRPLNSAQINQTMAFTQTRAILTPGRSLEDHPKVGNKLWILPKLDFDPDPELESTHNWVLSPLSYCCYVTEFSIHTVQEKTTLWFIHWKMTMWVLHNRPNGCKMEENESQEHISSNNFANFAMKEGFCTTRHSFCTHFVIFFQGWTHRVVFCCTGCIL